MMELRYRFDSLRADYLRAGAGLLLTLGPAALVPAGSAAHYVLLPAAALFLAFGLRTWWRQRSRLVLDEAGISLFSWRRVSLAWNGIRALKLAYYAVRTDRTGGWMQLTLKGERETIRVDSSLDRFEELVRRVAGAARTNGVTVSPATRANLVALGLDDIPEDASTRVDAPA